MQRAPGKPGLFFLYCPPAVIRSRVSSVVEAASKRGRGSNLFVVVCAGEIPHYIPMVFVKVFLINVNTAAGLAAQTVPLRFNLNSH